MIGLHFLRPEWLWLLPVAAILFWLALRRGGNSGAWATYCDPVLLEAQMHEGAGGRQWLPWCLLGASWMLGIIALAGPSWQQQSIPVYSELQSRVILFDLSRSMDSGDLSPSRLVRARFKLTDLVNEAGARQQALIVFAGDSFIVSPLTDDRDTLTNLIPALDTGTVPVQGSRADLALTMAAQLIDNADAKRVQVVLVTDGVNHDSIPIAGRLADLGHTVSVIAVGSEQGAPISLPEGGLLKDSAGNIVVAGVDHEMLRELTRRGRGHYVNIAADDSDIAWFNRVETPAGGLSLDVARTTVTGSGGTLRWLDGGIWLLLPLALLASFGFRRGALLGLLIATAVPDQAAIAFGWEDLWQRPNQRAASAINAGDPATVPSDASPEWQGVGAYRQDDYESAIAGFSVGDKAVDWFNRGNALAKAGRLQGAIDAYDAALERQGDMDDARANRELVSKLLDQQQQAGNQSGNQSNEKSDEQTREEQDKSQEDAAAGRDDGSGDAERAEPDQQRGTEPQDQTQGGDGEAADDDSEQQSDLADLPQPEDYDPAQQGTADTIARSPELKSEDRQALEQWLQRVPDDPGGLLRRKFRYQLGERPRRSREAQQW